MKSKCLESVEASAVVNHNLGIIIFTVDGITVTGSFTIYDEWGAINVGEYIYDFHIKLDEVLGVWLYGVEFIKGKPQTNVDNEMIVDFTEIGEIPTHAYS